MAEQPPTEEDLQDLIEAAQEARREFEAYNGDEYLISGRMDENTPFAKAVSELTDPRTLLLILSWGGLEYILADKYATAALKKLLIQRHPGILANLAAYAKQRKPKGKPGPKPKDGKHLYERIMELDAKRLSNGQISLAIFGTVAYRNLVAAHLTLGRKKVAHGRKKIPTRPAEHRPSNK